MKKAKLSSAGFALVFFFISLAGAVTPDEMLGDPALEARARGVSKKLRCVVCQNQSIDDSNAPLAHDMRVLVRERVLAGDSDAEIIAFLVARYGDFVLLEPPVRSDTLLLWLGPLLMLIAAGGGFSFYMRNRDFAPRGVEDNTLSEAEAKQVSALRERMAS